MVFAIFLVIFSYPKILKNFFNNRSIAFVLIFLFISGVLLIPMLFKYLFINSSIVILFIVILYLRDKKTLFKRVIFVLPQGVFNRFVSFVRITTNNHSKSTFLHYIAIRFHKHQSDKFLKDQTSINSTKTTQPIIVKSNETIKNHTHVGISFYNISLFGHIIVIPKRMVSIIFVVFLCFFVVSCLQIIVQPILVMADSFTPVP